MSGMQAGGKSSNPPISYKQIKKRENEREGLGEGEEGLSIKLGWKQFFSRYRKIVSNPLDLSTICKTVFLIDVVNHQIFNVVFSSK